MELFEHVAKPLVKDLIHGTKDSSSVFIPYIEIYNMTSCRKFHESQSQTKLKVANTHNTESPVGSHTVLIIKLSQARHDADGNDILQVCMEILGENPMSGTNRLVMRWFAEMTREVEVAHPIYRPICGFTPGRRHRNHAFFKEPKSKIKKRK